MNEEYIRSLIGDDYTVNEDGSITTADGGTAWFSPDGKWEDTVPEQDA